MNWINADIEFGVPMKTIVVSLRDLLEMNFTLDSTADPEVLADKIKDLVYKHRPELNDTGLSVFWMKYDGREMHMEFTVCHESFPKVDSMHTHTPPVERLHTCHRCGKPLPERGTFNMIIPCHGDPERTERAVQVCSKECHDHLNTPNPQFDAAAALVRDDLRMWNGTLPKGLYEDWESIPIILEHPK